MKTKILLAVFGLSFHSIFAHPFLSTFHVRTANNAAITVWVDGYKASEANNHAILTNLRAGQHSIRVVEVNRGYFGHPFMNVIYKGYINVQPATETFATIDNYNCMRIERTVACGRDERFDGYDRVHNGFDNYGNHPSNSPNAFPRPEVEPRPRPRCGNDSYYGPQAMNQFDFEQFRNNVAQQTFESTKMNVLKLVASKKYFTTNQVKELVNLFTFESSKLEVAKSLYDHTIDKQNYYQVNSTFTFSSSVDDLTQYLAMK
jgi:hypothetical protein